MRRRPEQLNLFGVPARCLRMFYRVMVVVFYVWGALTRANTHTHVCFIRLLSAIKFTRTAAFGAAGAIDKAPRLEKRPECVVQSFRPTPAPISSENSTEN